MLLVAITIVITTFKAMVVRGNNIPKIVPSSFKRLLHSSSMTHPAAFQLASRLNGLDKPTVSQYHHII